MNNPHDLAPAFCLSPIDALTGFGLMFTNYNITILWMLCFPTAVEKDVIHCSLLLNVRGPVSKVAICLCLVLNLWNSPPDASLSWHRAEMLEVLWWHLIQLLCWMKTIKYAWKFEADLFALFAKVKNERPTLKPWQFDQWWLILDV